MILPRFWSNCTPGLARKTSNIISVGRERGYHIFIIYRNFYILVGQKYDPNDGKWKHPYSKSRLQKFDGDGTLTASETESCAYILGNSSLKVLYFEQSNVVMIRTRQICFRQPVAQNAFPAVSATISTREGIKFGWKEFAKSTLMSKSMTRGITYTGSRMERCTFGMLWNNFSKSHGGPISPSRLFKCRKWTLTCRIPTKFGGELDITLLRVCKLLL